MKAKRIRSGLNDLKMQLRVALFGPDSLPSAFYNLETLFDPNKYHPDEPESTLYIALRLEE